MMMSVISFKAGSTAGFYIQKFPCCYLIFDFLALLDEAREMCEALLPGVYPRDPDCLGVFSRIIT